MNRALRRHHRERLKKKRRFYFGRDLSKDPFALSKAVDTPHPCSGCCCGNPRKHFDSLTIQERKVKEAEREGNLSK